MKILLFDTRGWRCKEGRQEEGGFLPDGVGPVQGKSRVVFTSTHPLYVPYICIHLYSQREFYNNIRYPHVHKVIIIQ